MLLTVKDKMADLKAHDASEDDSGASPMQEDSLEVLGRCEFLSSRLDEPRIRPADPSLLNTAGPKRPPPGGASAAPRKVAATLTPNPPCRWSQIISSPLTEASTRVLHHDRAAQDAKEKADLQDMLDLLAMKSESPLRNEAM